MVFVDTSVWFAYFLPLAAEHRRVRDALETANGPLITTDYCIDETLTLLVARGELRRAIAAGQAFFYHEISRLHFVSQVQIQRAWILFQQRAAAGWSFTDCTSKTVIDELDIKTALALDDHFRQFGNIDVVP